ncbi:MAG: hypothetical protein V3R33_05965, partial [Anaerolineales bacterium]
MAKGNAWAIAVSLILLTGITYAFLNDVTTILMLVPLSIQMASNIGDATTQIGDPHGTKTFKRCTLWLRINLSAVSCSTCCPGG